MLALLASRNVLTQLVGIGFALLAALHVALPNTLSASAVVAAAMLVITAVSAVSRFSVSGAGGDVKFWYQSKTIWTAIVSAAVSVLTIIFAVLGKPFAVDQESLVALIMIVVGVANVVLHKTSTAAIVAVPAAS